MAPPSDSGMNKKNIWPRRHKDEPQLPSVDADNLTIVTARTLASQGVEVPFDAALQLREIQQEAQAQYAANAHDDQTVRDVNLPIHHNSYWAGLHKVHVDRIALKQLEAHDALVTYHSVQLERDRSELKRLADKQKESSDRMLELEADARERNGVLGVSLLRDAMSPTKAYAVIALLAVLEALTLAFAMRVLGPSTMETFVLSTALIVTPILAAFLTARIFHMPSKAMKVLATVLLFVASLASAMIPIPARYLLMMGQASTQMVADASAKYRADGAAEVVENSVPLGTYWMVAVGLGVVVFVLSMAIALFKYVYLDPRVVEYSKLVKRAESLESSVKETKEKEIQHRITLEEELPNKLTIYEQDRQKMHELVDATTGERTQIYLSTIITAGGSPDVTTSVADANRQLFSESATGSLPDSGRVADLHRGNDEGKEPIAEDGVTDRSAVSSLEVNTSQLGASGSSIRQFPAQSSAPNALKSVDQASAVGGE